MGNLIEKSLIELDIEATTKEEVILQLSKKINETGRLANFDAYLKSVIDREELTSTGIGFGIAIPHGKSDAVKESAVAFGKLKKGMNWEAIDDEDVTMVFLLAVPEGEGNEHLKILSKLSRKLIHDDFRKTLTEGSKEVITSLLEETLKIEN